MSQLFHSPEIDKKLTFSAVEKALKEYKHNLLDAPDEMLPLFTDNYMIKIYNELANDQFKIIQDIHNAVNRLSIMERSIIIQKYLTKDDLFDHQVYNDLGISHRQYYRVRQQAFIKLARVLKIEVYNGPEEVSHT